LQKEITLEISQAKLSANLPQLHLSESVLEWYYLS